MFAYTLSLGKPFVAHLNHITAYLMWIVIICILNMIIICMRVMGLVLVLLLLAIAKKQTIKL
ncbi:hypothetical protein C9I99_02190 [Photobacterium lutimaris]|uniref:Uncharacterized protein n=1 Tax=Photobacterium lutimaris TaxID=388278 RepID=A0A2T3J3H5_9GAMM|nr:hypothetical protein C9I99_02190 [Photobacterium lutimaris]